MDRIVTTKQHIERTGMVTVSSDCSPGNRVCIRRNYAFAGDYVIEVTNQHSEDSSFVIDLNPAEFHEFMDKLQELR